MSAGSQDLPPPPSIGAAAAWLPLARALAIASCVLSFALLGAWIFIALVGHGRDAAVVKVLADAQGYREQVLALQGVLGLVGAVALAITGCWFTLWQLLQARAMVQEAIASDSAAAQQRAKGGSSLFAEVTGKAEIQARLDALVRTGGWRQGLVPAGFLLLALGMLAECRPLPGSVPSAVTLASLLLAMSFPLLLVERKLALARSAELPDAAAIGGLVRWQLAIQVLAAVLLLCRSAAPLVALWGERIAGILLGLVLLELLARCLALVFLPPPTPATAQLATDSLLARLLPWPGERRQEQDVLRTRFNIDLSRSWSLLLIRRMLLPVLLLLVVLCWLLSGLTILPINQRGVYERLGRPAGVLQPGLHVHLPWPFGIIHVVESGVIHVTALGQNGEPSTSSASATAPAAPAAPPFEPAASADGPAPASTDRLWNVPHPFEAVYLLPSTSAVTGDTLQAIQLVDTDVRIFYRVGLDDGSALDAAYRIDDGQALVVAAANQLLTQFYSTRTWQQVQQEDRATISDVMRTRLQAQLDASHSGLEITAVVIDSIHPPTETATATEAIQVAEISSRTEDFQAQQKAVQDKARGEQDANGTLSQAHAEAAEMLAKAHESQNIFETQVAPFQRYQAALRLELWLDHLTADLQKCKLIIIDHRMDLPDGVFLDLRAKE